MRARLLALTLIAGVLLPPGGYAASDNSAELPPETRTTESGRAMTLGVVKKVDKNLGKVTISHEPIVNLGMPKMTMIFRVKDPAMLETLKAGEKILFVAERVDGAFTVVQFEPAK